MAASGILSPPLQLVIGEDMVAGQQERYSAAASGKGADTGDDQSTINTAGSTASLSSNEDTMSGMLSLGSGGKAGAPGVELSDERESEGGGACSHSTAVETVGLISEAAAAAEAARTVRQHFHLQQSEGSKPMRSAMTRADLADQYSSAAPTPGSAPSSSLCNGPSLVGVQRSQSFEREGREQQGSGEHGTSYQYLGAGHVGGHPPAAGRFGGSTGNPGSRLLLDTPGWHPRHEGGSGSGSISPAELSELSERMGGINLQAQQQMQRAQQQQPQQGNYASAPSPSSSTTLSAPPGIGPSPRMNLGSRGSPLLSPNSDTSELTHGAGLHESGDGQSTVMSDLGSPASSSGFSLPPPASSPTNAVEFEQQQQQRMPNNGAPPSAATGGYPGSASSFSRPQNLAAIAGMQAAAASGASFVPQQRLGQRMSSDQLHTSGSEGSLHDDELGSSRGTGREGEEEMLSSSVDSTNSLGLAMGGSPFVNHPYHAQQQQQQQQLHHHHQQQQQQHHQHQQGPSDGLSQFNSNPYPYISAPPQEGMRPRSLSEGSLFYSQHDEGFGPSGGMYPPGLGPRGFQPGGYSMKPPLAAGIPQAQAQQMVQWITHFVRQKGGVITAANLGSALARLHPDFYSLIKASHGGLTAFLADYPERFSFANDPPFNHVFLSREVAAASPPSPSPPGLSMHPYSVSPHGPPTGPPHARLLKPLPSPSAGLPMSALPIRSRSMSDPRLSPQPLNTLVGGVVPQQMGILQGQPYLYAAGPHGYKLSSSPTSTGLGGGGGYGGSMQGPPSGLGGLSPLAAAGMAGMANSASWPLDQHLEAEVVKATAEILCNAASYALKAVELANTLRARLGTKVLAKVREKYGGLLFMLERHPHLFRVDRIPKNDCVTLLPKGLLLVTHPGTQVPAPSPSPYGSGGAHQQQANSVNMALALAAGQSQPVVSAYAHTIQQLQQQVAIAREKEAQAKQAAAVLQHRHGLSSHHGHVSSHGLSAAENLANASTLHQRRMGVGISPLVTHGVDLKSRMPPHLQVAAGMHQQHMHQGPPSLQQTPSLSGGLTLMPEPTALQRRHSWSNLISPGAVVEDSEPTDQAIGPPQGQRSLSATSFYGAPAPPSAAFQQPSPSTSESISLGGLYSGFGLTVDGGMDAPGPGAALSPESDEAVGPATSHASQTAAQQQGGHGQIEKMVSASSSTNSLVSQDGQQQPSVSSPQQQPSPPRQLLEGDAQQQPPHLQDSSDAGSSATDGEDKGEEDDDDDDDDAASGGSLSPGSEGVGGEAHNVGSAGEPMPPQMSMWGGKSENGEDRGTGLAGITLRGWDVVDGSVEDLLQQSKSAAGKGPMELGIPGLRPVAGAGSSSEGSSASSLSRGQSSPLSIYGSSPPSSSSSSARQPVGLGLGLGGVSMCPVLQILTNNHFVPTQAWPAEPLRDSTYVNLIVEELRNVGGTTTVSKLRGLLKHKLGSKETIKSVPLKALLQAYRTVFTLHRNHVTLNGPLRL